MLFTCTVLIRHFSHPFLSLAFNPLILMYLPFAPSESLPRPHPDADLWPSDALTRRPIDSVVFSALRNYQWLLDGAGTPVALQGRHTVSSNNRHHLLLPPVSNPPWRTDRTNAMDSTTLPRIPFLLCPPSSNPILCLSVTSGSGYVCMWVYCIGGGMLTCCVSSGVALTVWLCLVSPDTHLQELYSVMEIKTL